MMVIGVDLAFWKWRFNCVTRSQAAGNPGAALELAANIISFFVRI